MPELSLVLNRDLEKENIAKKRDYYAVIMNTLLRSNRYVGETKGNLPTKQETRVFLYAVSCIQPTDTCFHDIVLNVIEFGRLCGFDASSGNYYKDIANVVGRLKSRVVWVPPTDEHSKKIEAANILGKAELEPGKITICLDQKLKPFLLGITSNYSKFSLHDALRMKSQFGPWLWMVLTSYTHGKTCSVTFDIDELKEYLDCTNYTRISNLKEKVIGRAVRDINNYTSMKITDVTYRKEGRVTKYVTFHIEDLLKVNPQEYNARYLRAEREFAKYLSEQEECAATIESLDYTDLSNLPDLKEP